MTKRILILTCAGDLHSYAVAEAIRRKGGAPLLWLTTDFPSRTVETLSFDGSSSSLHVDGVGVDLSSAPVHTVWRRRPAHSLDDRGLHPGDREFAQLECAIFRRSLLPVIFPEAFWVNPPDAAVSAGRKIIQYKLAAELGLKQPATVFTNDPRRIHELMAHHGGRIVYKTFQAAAWQSGTKKAFAYSTLLTEDDLVEDDLLRAVPGIYQELVPKEYELRVTVMGNRLFAFKIHSQEAGSESGALDWRKSGESLRIESTELVPSVQANCLTLMRRLGLVFGCIDLIVTPGGDSVFLEVNEMGQFLFLEEKTGVPLLDAMAELLLQGRPDFILSQGASRIRFEDITGAAEEQAAKALREHAAPPTRSYREK
jgi:hypothetical protein